MRLNKVRSILLAIIFSLAGLYSLFGLIGAAPALAYDPMHTGIEIVVFDDGQTTLEMLDDRGNLIGEAVRHSGQVLCTVTTCSGSIVLGYMGPLEPVTVTYEIYGPYTRTLSDTVTVNVTGTLSNEFIMGPMEGIFQDNKDGTVWVKYGSSRTDTSFTLPRTPGSIRFDSN